jgi:hypothetical protein
VKGVGVAIKKPRPRKGEKISSPVMITGTVNKPPPEGWAIYLVGIGSRDNRPTYFPYHEVNLLPDRRWSIEYKSGSGPRKLQLYLVGKDGQALMNAFSDINREHLDKVRTFEDMLAKPFTMGGLAAGADPDIFALMRNVFGAKPGSHAPLRALTNDMLPACAPLHVHIAEPHG